MLPGCLIKMSRELTWVHADGISGLSQLIICHCYNSLKSWDFFQLCGKKIVKMSTHYPHYQIWYEAFCKYKTTGSYFIVIVVFLTLCIKIWTLKKLNKFKFSIWTLLYLQLALTNTGWSLDINHVLVSTWEQASLTS